MRKHYSKFILSLSLAGIMSVNVFAATTFTDVNNKHWAYPGISYMQDKGYMTKNSSGAFAPAQEMTYFDIAEVLAKATGYQDALVIKDMDPALKKQIADNYEKQKPTLATYTSKYGTWESRCNEEIAYLLGRGYLTEAELSRFMIKTADGKEIKNTLTKQDMVTLLVRVIGKKISAEEAYIGKTKFADNDLIRKENRPYAAYYNQIGLLNGDDKGNMGANTKVTRALGAQMTYAALMHKEKLENTTTITGKVNKIVPKNNAAGETYLRLEVNGKTTICTANAATKVTNANGQAVAFSKVAIGEKVAVTVTKENGVELLKTIQLVDHTTGGTTKPETTPETDKEETTTPEQAASSYLGNIENIGRSGTLSVATNQGTVTYVLAKDCEIKFDGGALILEDLLVGDRVRIYVEENKITKVNVLSRAEAEEVKAEFVKVTNRVTSYMLTVLEGTKEKTVEVEQDADITRNGKRAELGDLRVGDTLEIKMDGKVAVEVHATSEEASFTGTIENIIISRAPQIVVRSKGELKTVNITKNTELYDSTSKNDITIRELLMDSKVEVLTESKEAVSVVVKDVPTEVSFKGTVEYVGPSAKYIDVLVEYDVTTGETMVLRRINIPTQVKVIVDRQVGYRNQIKKGMEVLAIYNYGEEMNPHTIEIVSK
ncbi:MAG: S-layer homology domain-containing protein [Niameybacter sp.]